MGQVEHVDGLVGGLEVALRGVELRDALLDAPAVEDVEGVVAPQVGGQVVLGLHAHLVVEEMERLARLPLVEGRPHRQHVLRVRRAALEAGQREQADKADRDRPSQRPGRRAAAARRARRYRHRTALVM